MLRTPSLFRNGLYNVGGQAIRGALSLLAIPLLIRFLGIREYGVWSLAYATLALISMGEAGISVGAAVFLSRDIEEEDFNQANQTVTFVFVSGALLAGLMGLLLWFAGPLLVRALNAFGSADRLEAGRALQIAGFAAFAYILQRAFVGIEQAFDRYAAINALDVSQALLTNIGLIIIAWLGGRTIALMEWQVVAWALLLAVHGYFVFRLLRHTHFTPAWSKGKARRIFRFSAATWFSTLGSAAFGQCDRLIVGGLLGAPVLGIYSAITNITSKINSFSGMAVQPLVPSLSRDAAAKGPVERRVREAAHLNALIAIEAGIFLYVLADWVMRVMVPGATVPHGVLGLQIAAIVYALYSCNAPGYFILFAAGDARTNAIVTLSSAVTSLGLIFLGARYWGLLGSLAGNVGYLGTLLMIALGLRKVGVALRRYLAWVAIPLLGLAAALLVGLFREGYLWWRIAFVIVQGGLFMLWFLRSHGGLAQFRPGWGSVVQG